MQSFLAGPENWQAAPLFCHRGFDAALIAINKMSGALGSSALEGHRFAGVESADTICVSRLLFARLCRES